MCVGNFNQIYVDLLEEKATLPPSVVVKEERKLGRTCPTKLRDNKHGLSLIKP